MRRGEFGLMKSNLLFVNCLPWRGSPDGCDWNHTPGNLRSSTECFPAAAGLTLQQIEVSVAVCLHLIAWHSEARPQFSQGRFHEGFGAGSDSRGN